MPTIRKETLLSHELDGDLVLYDPDLDLVHTLNTTARQVWECCDGVQTDEEIVEEISRRYDSPAGRVRADVHRTLAQLKRREFLRDSHEDGPIPGLGDSRRTFLKVGLKGVALLPYVAPLIETIALSDAEAQGTPINSNVPPGPPPSVSSCSPDNADKGDTLNVTVSGADFVPTPTADFGSGITINNVTFDTSSQLTVNITISVAATAGSRNVTITNPDAQSDTLVSGFTVNAAPPPTVTSCVPEQREQKPDPERHGQWLRLRGHPDGRFRRENRCQQRYVCQFVRADCEHQYSSQCQERLP